jgi:hypothetical protein
MVGYSIWYLTSNEPALQTTIFMGVVILTYILPLLLNISRIKVCEFLKGIVYVTYLTPTYINIFTIYAISNIHDVSWGSRPSTKEDTKSDEEKESEEKKELNFKNYRSWFLCIWLVINCVVGVSIVTLSRGNDRATINMMAMGLACLISFKLFISILHIVVSKFEKWRVKKEHQN